MNGLSQWTGKMVFDGGEVLAVTARAFLRGAHAGQDVLLDQHVALVVGLGEAAQQAREVDGALAQFTEDAVAQRLKVVPPGGTRLGGDTGVAVLEVDIPDAFAETVERRDGVRATGPVSVVAGIEHEAECLRIGQFEELGDLVVRLDGAGAMVMEDGLQARLGLHASMSLMPDWARHLTGTYHPAIAQRLWFEHTNRLQANLVRWAYPLPCKELALARVAGTGRVERSTAA